MQIMRATPDDAARLTEIAFAAKRHWGYPEKWIESWRELLTIQPEFIVRNETYLAINQENAEGFYTLSRKDDRLELTHLWVSPLSMGQGIGRSSFVHALERAYELGFKWIEIESDPNAEGFYRRMGAGRIGSSIREMFGQCRDLPILNCDTRQKNAVL